MRWLFALALSAVATAAMAQEAVHFTSLDGTTNLTAYLSRPQNNLQDDAPRPALVLLHGCSGLVNRTGHITALYRAWIRTLLAKGYVVLAVDSATAQTKPYTSVEAGSWATTVPLLLLMGEADTWTPFKPCAAFLGAARDRGSPVEIKSYPQAVHAFDAPDLERRELPAYRTGDGPIPVIATDDEARADAVLRVLAFLKARLG